MSALHTVWHRYHNSLEERLRRLNPHWGGEKLFEETRRIIGAISQHITYNEYVPTVVGPREMEKYRLNLATSGHFDRKLMKAFVIYFRALLPHMYGDINKLFQFFVELVFFYFIFARNIYSKLQQHSSTSKHL